MQAPAIRRLFSAIPSGLLRFAGARLFRGLISLIIFQIVLFGLIQALPRNNAAMSFGEVLAQLPAGRVADEPQSPNEPAAATQTEATGSDAGGGENSFAALRESGSPEMQALLMEAEFLEAAVASQSAAQQVAGEQAVGATQLEPPAGQNAPGVAAEPAVDIEPAADVSPDLAAEPGPPAAPMTQVDSVPADYEQGLRALRPPGDPAIKRFVTWAIGFFQGDLGHSASSERTPVSEIIAAKLPRTLLLLVPGTLAGFALGVWLGKHIGWRRRGWLDTISTLGGTLFYTSFPPWLAFLVVSVFAVNLRWFPREKLINANLLVFADIRLNDLIMRVLLTMTAIGLACLLIVWFTRRLWRNRVLIRVVGFATVLVVAVLAWNGSGRTELAIDMLDHLVLPLVALTLLSFGETMLIMRTTMAEVKQEDYVKQAKLMGYDDRRLRDRHVGRVAMLPVLPRFIVQLPLVIIGSFVLESVFAWDGIAQELVRAADQGDLPVLLGVLSLVGVGLLLAHVVLDVLTAYLDPRLRTSIRSGAG